MSARIRAEELVEFDNNFSRAPEGNTDKFPPVRRVTRDSRKPFGSIDQKLAFPKREGYHRHWFNDDPGRIYQAQEAGYTQVTDTNGKPASRVVGVTTGGGPQMAYLMEIPIDWWTEDMDRGQAMVAEKEKGIKRGVVSKSDPKDAGKEVFYAGSDKGSIDIHDSFSRPRS
jgi:hypothetical protein